MIESERKQIIDLIKKEVIPAIGCTEPIAVALCVAKAAETLGMKPEKIEVLLSANILKNAMGVGIPGTDMVGLPIAVALGVDRPIGISTGSVERLHTGGSRTRQTVYRREANLYFSQRRYYGKTVHRSNLHSRQPKSDGCDCRRTYYLCLYSYG